MHSLAARPLPSQELFRALLTFKDGTCLAMQAKHSSFRLSWFYCYSDCARHCVCLHHAARFKPNLPNLPALSRALPQPGEPTKLPKAQILCTCDIQHCLVPLLCRELQWGFGDLCYPLNGHNTRTVLSFGPLTLKRSVQRWSTSLVKVLENMLSEEGLRELGLFISRKGGLGGPHGSLTTTCKKGIVR